LNTPADPHPVREATDLAENAFRELSPGETFRPVVPAAAAPLEVTVRSVVQGFVWALIFSAAATYIALKLGQGIESAIPISILAVGVSAFLVRALGSRPSTLLENVNVLAVGATSGIVAGGSVFTMPAIFILGLEGRSGFWQIFLVPLLGAVLGVFLLAPFRRYFTRDLHGKLPFPEARATTEILVAGNALFATDFYVGYTNSISNVHLVLNTFDQLALDPDLITIRSREISSSPILESRKTKQVPILLINMLAAPILLLAAGVVIGYRRKKKEAMA